MFHNSCNIYYLFILIRLVYKQMANRKKGNLNLKKQPPGIFRPPIPVSNQNRLKQIYEAKNIITPSKKPNNLSANPNTVANSNGNNFNINVSQREGQKVISQTQKQNKYHLPLPITKRQRLDISQGNINIHDVRGSKTNRYRQYLQSAVANITEKEKHSHRYSNMVPIADRVDRSERVRESQREKQRSYQRNQYERVQPKQRPKLSSVYNLNQTESIRQSNLNNNQNTYRERHRNTNNQSADMFKIRQKKTPYQRKRVNPVVNSSNIKASQGEIDLDFLEEGKIQYRKGNNQQALKLFEAGISHGKKHPEMHYYAALIYLNQVKYQEGYEHLKTLLKGYPSFKKTVYLFIAIACKNIGSIEQKNKDKGKESKGKGKETDEVGSLNKTKKDDMRKEAIRSKLSKYSKISEIQKDTQDEDQEINVSVQRLEQGIRYCTLGINKFPDYVDLIAYRGKLFQYSKKFQQAHLDFQKVLQVQSENVQALYRDAQCLKELGFVNNCIAKCNKALSLDQNGPFTVKILFEKVGINLESNKIQDAKRDVEMLLSLLPQSSKVHLLQGKIYALQGNRRKSVLSFQQVLNFANSKKAMNQALIQITKHKIEDRDFYSALHHINRSQFLELSNSFIELYRKFTEGVIFLMKRKILQGVNNFNQIIEKYEKELDNCPYIKKIFYLYRAFGHFMLSQHDKAIQDYQLSQKLIPKNKSAYYNQLLAKGIVEVAKEEFQKSFQFFNKAQSLMADKIQPFIYRAVANIQRAKQKKRSHSDQELLQLQLIFAGLKQLELANQINDSNSNLLYIRCLIYLYLGKTEQALEDIVKAISKSQQNIPKYFFYRAMAHNTMGNKKQALNDLNICINLDQNFKLAFFERTKIHFHNLSINKGIEDLKKFSMLQQKQLILSEDCQVKSVEESDSDSLVGGYNQSDIKCHQFLLYFSLKMYEQAEQVLDEIKDETKKKQLKINLYLKQGKPIKAKQLMQGAADKSICDIIGNVPLQKDALQKAIQVQRSIMDKHKNRQENELSTEMEAKKLGLKYFNIVHYYHYLGVLSFRVGQYDQAINNFILALKQKNLSDLQQGVGNSNIMSPLDQDNQETSQMFDTAPQEPEQNSINFNMFLCFLVKGDIKKAYEVYIRDILPAKQSLLKNQEMGEFSHLLFQTMKNAQHRKKQEAQENRKDKHHSHSRVGKTVDQTNESLPIFTLPLMMTAYSNLTDSVAINLPNFSLITKLSLPVPHPTNLLKPYCLKLNPQFILQNIRMSQVENRPQPPWIKRTAEGLMFTDDVRQINVEFQTTINDEEEEQEEEDQQEQEDEQNEQNNSDEDSQEQEEEQIDFRKLKDKMKLDDSIERKLKKIMQKKQ